MPQLLPHLAPPGGTSPEQNILNLLVVDEFIATPLTFDLCTTSPSIHFHWKVSGPVGTPTQFFLQVGTQIMSVDAIGSRSVQISSPVAFTFYVEYINHQGQAVAGRVLRLNSITAAPSVACQSLFPLPPVVPSSCQVTETTSALAASATPSIQATVASKLNPYDMSLKSISGWAIDPSGIHVHLSVALPTDINLIDIGVDVTAVPVLNPQGQLSMKITQLNAQANFPWWVYVLAPAYLAEDIAVANLAINNILIPFLTPALASDLQQAANNGLLSALGILSGKPVRQVLLEDGQMVLTYCTASLLP